MIRVSGDRIKLAGRDVLSRRQIVQKDATELEVGPSDPEITPFIKRLKFCEKVSPPQVFLNARDAPLLSGRLA